MGDPSTTTWRPRSDGSPRHGRRPPSSVCTTTSVVAAYLNALRAAQEATGEQPTPDELWELEVLFVSVARSYSSMRGIEYATWREAGVPVRVLGLAAIQPGAEPEVSPTRPTRAEDPCSRGRLDFRS